MHNSSATISRLVLPDTRSVWEAVETEEILTIAFNIVRDGNVRMTEMLHCRSLEYHLKLLEEDRWAAIVRISQAWPVKPDWKIGK